MYAQNNACHIDDFLQGTSALPEYVQAEVVQLRYRLQEEKDRNRNLQRVRGQCS
jgi:hypothetical protein